MAAMHGSEKTDLLTKVFAALGVLAVLGVLGGLIWRFIWLMNHN
jgi:hypothetical protein